MITHRLNPIRIAVATLVGTLLVSGTIVAAFILAYQDRIYPNIDIAGIPVGGLTPSEAHLVVSHAFSLAEQTPLTLILGGREIQIRTEELGLTYTTQQSVERAFAIGRSKSLLQNVSALARSMLDQTSLPAHFRVDPILSTETLSALIIQATIPPVPARFEASGSALVVTNEQPGQTISPEIVIALLQRQLETFKRTPIGIPTMYILPHRRTTQLTAFLPMVASIAAHPPNLVVGELTNTPTATDIAAWYSPPEDPVLPPSFTVTETLALQSQERLPYETMSLLNNDAIDRYLAKLAQLVDRLPQDALFRMEGNRVAAFRPSQDGVTLDRGHARTAIIGYLSNPSGVALTLQTKTTPPAVRIDSINNLGIQELLGRGITKFAGSIPGRMHNIRLSAQRISGVILKPGEEFGFNATVGDVSKETGYQPAYIIENGRTVLGDGGGVCQTSTTLFRAVLNAGLPIVERHAHAYRVGYYEQNSAPGLDATVFSPKVDFRFKNDTPQHILVQTIFDPATATLTTEIYGTSDGRTVSISKPIITNEVKPPSPRYQDDPELPKGTTKQIDWSAWGAHASFNRTVTRGGQVLYDSPFKSVYRPWQAVYLVGTR